MTRRARARRGEHAALRIDSAARDEMHDMRPPTTAHTPVDAAYTSAAASRRLTFPRGVAAA